MEEREEELEEKDIKRREKLGLSNMKREAKKREKKEKRKKRVNEALSAAIKYYKTAIIIITIATGSIILVSVMANYILELD